MTDATTSGLFTVTSSDVDRNVIVVCKNNETKKRVRTSSTTSSSSETSSIENNKRICYEGCNAADIITGLLSLDHSNNGIINAVTNNNSTSTSTSTSTILCLPTRQFDLPIPNPLALPVSSVVAGQPQEDSLVFPPAADLLSNTDQDHAEATTAGVEEAIAEVEEALFGTIGQIPPPSTVLTPATIQKTMNGITNTNTTGKALAMAPAAPTFTPTVTTDTKKTLLLCQRPLCAKPDIRAATGAITNELSSSLRQTTATATTTTTANATGVSTHTAIMSRVIAPPTAPAPATPSVSVSTSVPYRTYAYQQVPIPVTKHTPQQGTTSGTRVIASALVLPAAATACISLNSATTYRNPTTQQRLILWKQQQLIQQQQQQVRRLAQQQQQVQQLAQQQQRTQQQTSQGHRVRTVQQQQQQRQQQYQRQQQGIYHMDDEECPSQSHIRTSTHTRRCPLSKPPPLPTTIWK